MSESASVVLAGRGNADHPVLAFLGQNPGREEVKQGLPFVGPSGKVLASFLQRAGIDEADCYFTNVVKCATPKNREPTVTEAKEWRAHLIEELQRVQPKVIVPLGNFAYKEVCGRSGISRAAGQPRTPHERLGLAQTVVVPAYHPAYALRNPAFSEPIVQALSYARSLAAGTATKVEPRIVWVDKLNTPRAVENVTDQITDAEVLTYDIETNAREFDDPAFRVYLIAVDVGEWTFVFGPGDKSIRTGTVLLGMSRGTKVGHNAIRFDAEALARIEPTACKGLKYETQDTMLLDYLLDDNAASHGLEPACHRVLGVAEWKSVVTWSWHDTPAGDIPWETAVQYCANDAKATRLLYDSLSPRVAQDTGLARVYDILRTASPAFVELERNGVYIRTDYCKQAIEERFGPMAGRALAAMQEQLGKEDFNPNSPKQVGAALFERFGATPINYTDTQQPSTDETTLKTLRELYPAGTPLGDFCTNLLIYRESQKIISTYLQAYIKHAHDDSRVHPSYGLTTTVTGRTSCFKPNYENVPRDPYVRMMIGAPEGKTFISSDYCVAPDTRVLTTALVWKKAKDISIGDELIGFDEKLGGHQNKYRPTTVLRTSTKTLPCYRIETSRGEIIASANHAWVCRKPQLCVQRGTYRNIRRWTETKDLKEGDLLSYFVAGRRTWGGKSEPAKVMRTTYIGEQSVVAFETSTKTFIAEGFLSHNSQAELRIGAMVAQEQGMLAAFAAGEDLHTLLAQQITGRKHITKEERYAAKVANFAFLYGAEEYTFVEYAFKNFDIRFTMAEARRIREAFFAKWTGLEAWYGRCAKEITETGQMQSITGQIRRLPQIYADDPKTRIEALRQGINFSVQNPSAHLGILACTFIVPAVKPYGARVVGFVHDAIHVEAPDTAVRETALAMRGIMETEVPRYLQETGVCISVPLIADIETGPSWGELTKWTTDSSRSDTRDSSLDSTNPASASDSPLIPER